MIYVQYINGFQLDSKKSKNNLAKHEGVIPSELFQREEQLDFENL